MLYNLGLLIINNLMLVKFVAKIGKIVCFFNYAGITGSVSQIIYDFLHYV